MTDDIKNVQNIPDDNVSTVLGIRGFKFPIVSINSYTFLQTEIKLFELSDANFLPEITLIVEVTTPTFRLKHIPHSGDLISVFIRADAPVFKDINCDFAITTFETYAKNNDNEGVAHTFVFHGVLHIPTFYFDVTEEYLKLTSYEVIEKICEKLGLGFVSNEEYTDDAMNWICAANSMSNFLQKDIALHVYKDTESFFKLWVDCFYNITLCNVGKIFLAPDDLETRLAVLKQTDIYSTDRWYQDAKDFHSDFRLMLSNLSSFVNSNMYFNKFDIVNKSGLIESVLGFKSKLTFYDELLKKLPENIELMAFKSDDSANKITMLGRPKDDTYKTAYKNYNSGIITNKDNLHAFYNVAKFQNIINNFEIEKMSAILYMPQINLNIYKGMLLQVAFAMSEDVTGTNLAGDNDDEFNNAGFVIDRSLSGNWFVSGITYTYNYNSNHDLDSNVPIGKWEQSVKICKREFTMPTTPKYKKSNRI